MSTLDQLLETLKDEKNNFERRNYLYSIVNDKSLAEDNLKKIASEILLEDKFLDIYFKVSFMKMIKISCTKFVYFFKI